MLPLTLAGAAGVGWAKRPPTAKRHSTQATVRAPRRLPTTDSLVVNLRPVDPRPQRILVVGDSMIYNLLPVLADYALENGHYLHPAIWWGSTSAGWAGTAKLTELIRDHRPTFVLMVLGSSEILGKGIDPIVTRAIARLKSRIGDRLLAWVGPPNWRPDTGINEVLQRELGAGHFFRSAELELEREADGIHPNRAGGRKWANHIIRWLIDESAVPIRLAAPTRVATVPGATCYGAAWKTKDNESDDGL